MTSVGVILSGCGVFDGSEIQEAVSCLIALDQRGVVYRCMAPRRPFEVVDHVTQKPTGEKRDVFTESARIARGELVELSKVRGGEYDAFILPGGFGAAKNLCTFAREGAKCSVDAETARVLREAQAAGRPIGFACIAPAIGAKVFGDLQPALTIGHDAATAGGLEALGARHVACDVEDIVVDEAHGLVSTPAYMEGKGPAEVFAGIDKMIDRVLEMAASPAAPAAAGA